MKISKNFAVILGNMSSLVNKAAELVGYAELTHVVKFEGREDGLVINMVVDLNKRTIVKNRLEIKYINNAISTCIIGLDDIVFNSNHYEILTEAAIITSMDNGEIKDYTYEHETDYTDNIVFDAYYSTKVIHLTEEQFELNNQNVKNREAKIMDLS